MATSPGTVDTTSSKATNEIVESVKYKRNQDSNIRYIYKTYNLLKEKH